MKGVVIGRAFSVLTLQMASHSSSHFQKLEEQLTCSVCLDLYIDPRILPCHHSFCHDCLDALPLYLKPNDSNTYCLHCPTCRSPTTLPGEEGAASLPIAFELNNFREIYDKMKASEQRSSSSSSGSYGSCHIHKREMEIFCDTCNALICINCTRESHKDHDWNTVAESYQR